MENYFGNPNFCHSAVVNMAASPASEFKISDYLILEDVVDYHHEECWSLSTETESSEKANSSDASHGFGDATSSITTTTNNNMLVFFFLIYVVFFVKQENVYGVYSMLFHVCKYC